MEQATGRAQPRKRGVLSKIAAGLAGAILLIALGLPLALRGPVIRWVAARASASLCGTVTLGGGHFGWAAVIDLVRARPIPFVLEDVRIAGADGQLVLAAQRLEGALQLHRSGAVVVPELTVSHGGWRLALDPAVLGTADAFRSVPPAGRAACLELQTAHPPARQGGGGRGGSLALRHIQLVDMNAELDFPTWGLTLAHAEAVGSMSAGGSGPVFLFEVRDAVARGGSVRIGGGRSPWRTSVRFDAVSISRVGVLPESPTDLTLQVAAATTAGEPSAARLSGHASFQNIFPAPGGRPPPGQPGLDADVQWSRFGAALDKLEAGWRPTGAWLRRIDGDLHARVQGPFTALAGTLEIQGGGTTVTARVAQGTADLRLTLKGVDTDWLLDPALRPLLGGELHGRFHATARLAPTFAGIRADIPDADLRLERRRAPRGPRRYELRISSPPQPPSVDALVASVDAVRLSDATLRLRGVQVSWPGLSASVDAEVAFPAETARGERPRSHVDARGSLAVMALEDWIPGGVVTGPLRVEAAARGTIQRVELGLSFPPPSTVTVLGQRFLLPRHLNDLLVSDTGLRVPPFQLRRMGGGLITAGGRLGPENRLGGTLGVRDYPVAAIPGIDRAGLPPLGGTLRAELALAGTTERPGVSGNVAIAALSVDRKPVGDLSADVRLAGETGELSATIDPGVTLRARVRRRGALAVDAQVGLRDRPLGPWLPAPVTGAAVTVSGDATVAYRAGAPLNAAGKLVLAGPGLTGVHADAQVKGGDASAHLAGQVDVAAWPQVWPRLIKSAAGVLDVDVALADALAHPRASGQLRIARALVVRTTAWPAPLALEAGARFDLDGTALAVSGLALSTPGAEARLAGRATLDLDDPARTALALDLHGTLDAARFPMQLPGSATARGRVDLEARVGGTLAGAPGPRVDGRAKLQDLTVRLSRSAPAVQARGDVEAHGDVVRTAGVDVQVDGVGAVRVGSAGTPAEVRIVSLSPFRLGAIDIPFSGSDLTIGTRSSEIYLPDLDGALRLTGDARTDLTLRGEVGVSGGVLDPSKGQARPKARVSGPWWHSLPPHLTLDLDLRGSRKGIRVEVPVLPDVTVDFRCHLFATNRGATWSGHLGGDSAYARAAVTIYDWFTPENLRKCQLTK